MTTPPSGDLVAKQYWYLHYRRLRGDRCYYFDELSLGPNPLPKYRFRQLRFRGTTDKADTPVTTIIKDLTSFCSYSESIKKLDIHASEIFYSNVVIRITSVGR
jgi:hypothetical protein